MKDKQRTAILQSATLRLLDVECAFSEAAALANMYPECACVCVCVCVCRLMRASSHWRLHWLQALTATTRCVCVCVCVPCAAPALACKNPSLWTQGIGACTPVEALCEYMCVMTCVCVCVCVTLHRFVVTRTWKTSARALSSSLSWTSMTSL